MLSTIVTRRSQFEIASHVTIQTRRRSPGMKRSRWRCPMINFGRKWLIGRTAFFRLDGRLPRDAADVPERAARICKRIEPIVRFRKDDKSEQMSNLACDLNRPDCG